MINQLTSLMNSSPNYKWKFVALSKLTFDCYVKSFSVRMNARVWLRLSCYFVEGSGKDVPNIVMSRMAEALSDMPPEPYSETLAKFDWEKVRFASYSADDCKRIWSQISRQVCYLHVIFTLCKGFCSWRSCIWHM